MKTENKKGFGLVMAIVIVLLLSIMSAGFFWVTNQSTLSVRRNEQSLRLYWAAESASNYNVNWWVNQDPEVRINWNTHNYTPPADMNQYQEAGSGLEAGRGSSTSQFGIGTNQYNSFPDENQYVVYEKTLPNYDEKNPMTIDGRFYVHASSVFEHPGRQIDGFEIINVRYKGSRFDNPDEAVWLLESYAWDPDTGELAGILLSNVYNQHYIANLEWLENSEAIVTSLFSTGFGGAQSALNYKDVRYGPVYYASRMRLDVQTGDNNEGPRFFSYAGTEYGGISFPLQTVKSSADAQTWWGNSEGQNVLDMEHYFGMGLGIRGQFTEPEVVDYLTRSFKHPDGRITRYDKNADPLDPEGVTWKWADIVIDGPGRGMFILPSDGSGAVDIEVYTKDGSTFAKVSTLNNDIPIGKGSGFYSGIAVPDNYGNVTIKGNSYADFTLVTERSQITVTDHFYAKEVEHLKTYIHDNRDEMFWHFTNPAHLENLWKAMKDSGSKTKLSVISQLGLDETQIATQAKPIIYNTRDSETLFTTAAYVSQNTTLQASDPTKTFDRYRIDGTWYRPGTRFVNIGSAITLNEQGGSAVGDPANAMSKILIQDQRYLDPTFGLPEFWGPGPEFEEQFSLYGLNRQHRWAKVSTQKTKDWNSVVWRNGRKPF